jgi:hypothetical protein
MKPLGFKLACSAVLLGLAAACISCNRHNAHSGKTTSINAKPGPEESYNLIIETFRRRMLDAPIGFVISDSTGRSTMTGTNKVDDELIRPAKETDPFRAVITVTSESHYSLKRNKDSSEDAARDKNADPQASNPLAETGDRNGVQSFDSSVIGSSSADTQKPDSPLRTTDDVIRPPQPVDVVRKYELQYENGRWILVTELDKKTEQSIENAFKSALDTQF